LPAGFLGSFHIDAASHFFYNLNFHSKLNRVNKTSRAATHLWTLPAKQERSRQTRDRLLAAGRKLLEKGGFEETSIADLARQAGCSVGSFYFRFKDKEAFYQAVMALVAQEIMARIEKDINPQFFTELSAARTVEACVDYLIDLYAQHGGLIRTVQRKSMQERNSLVPLQQTGLLVINHLANLIEAKYGEQGNAVFHGNLLVGFQLAFSVMLAGLLNRPQILSPGSPEYRFWIKEIVMHALVVKNAPHARAPEVRQGRAA
jgi:AcrR family transcriptional regulator